MRVLIVEDDPLIGRGIQVGLEQQGFGVDWIRDGAGAAAALTGEPYSAVVLDLGLPGIDGLQVLRSMRARKDPTPVLILTARDAIDDRVRGLDAGADDYLLKPFDLKELAARLRALVRRAHGAPTPVLEAAGIALDPAARTVRYRGQAVDLGAREFEVLRELLLNAGRVLSRDQLVERVYSWGEEVESNAIEVHVHHLRRKLSPQVIRTIRGVGYLIPREADTIGA
jgi:two-component system OmpR family response regulator/two-component system response regulator QseB